MRMNRASLIVLVLAAGVVAALRAGQPAKPERPMQVEKVKENLYVLRGPFHLKLADLGWDRTVSTVAFKGGLKGYYDEMKAVR
jgi:hypothetical protein